VIGTYLRNAPDRLLQQEAAGLAARLKIVDDLPLELARATPT
jgi:hypothetical protein